MEKVKTFPYAFDMKQIINYTAINKKLKNIKNEFQKREKILITLSYKISIAMDNVDRRSIQNFFEKGNAPSRPNSILSLMKYFFTSCFSYAPLRKYLTSINGSIPSPNSIANCLSKVYQEKNFLLDEKWYPERLDNLAQKIQRTEKYDLLSKQFKPRMIRVLLDGSKEMSFRLKGGLVNFYNELEAINKSSPEVIWEYVTDFQKNIRNVGTALICDFIKDIGFTRFVKIDHHFQKEFPELLGLENCNNLSPKQHFILSQQIADSIGMTPFHFDHLLYQWGRYKKYAKQESSYLKRN
jgi:hypothetical protein